MAWWLLLLLLNFVLLLPFWTSLLDSCWVRMCDFVGIRGISLGQWNVLGRISLLALEWVLGSNPYLTGFSNPNRPKISCWAMGGRPLYDRILLRLPGSIYPIRPVDQFRLWEIDRLVRWIVFLSESDLQVLDNSCCTGRGWRPSHASFLRYPSCVYWHKR